MNRSLIIIRDIFLSKADLIREALQLEWEHQAQQARIWRQYREVVASNDQHGHDEAAEQLHHISIEEQFLALVETKKLRRLSARYGFDMPDPLLPGNYATIEWDYDKSTPNYLTAHGMATARQALRAARKERREAAGFWFGVVVGVIGALTGLISVIA